MHSRSQNIEPTQCDGPKQDENTQKMKYEKYDL